MNKKQLAPWLGVYLLLALTLIIQVYEMTYWDDTVGTEKAEPAWVNNLIQAVRDGDKPNEARRSFVSITFDDGLDDHYIAAFPILRRLNIPATVYIVTDNVGGDGYMTKAQLEELASYGWEIGGHTKTHPADLTALNDAQRDTEMDKSTYFMANGFDVQTFAYPGGTYDAATIRSVKKNGYSAARTTSSAGVFNEVYLDFNLYALECQFCPEVLNSVQDVKDQIDNAMAASSSFPLGQWLILGFHNVPYAGGAFPTLSDFEGIADYILSSGISYGTVRDILRLHPSGDKHGSIWIPADMFGNVGAANGALGNFPTLRFDDTAIENAYTSFPFPQDMQHGTNIWMRLYYAMESATSGAVRWETYYRTVKDGDALAGANDSGISENVAVPGTSGVLDVWEIWLTDLNAVLDEIVGLQVRRKADDAGDTATGDAHLVGVELLYALKH